MPTLVTAVPGSLETLTSGDPVAETGAALARAAARLHATRPVSDTRTIRRLIE